MSLETLTQGMRDKVGSDCGIAKVIKFDFGDEGVITIDGASTPNTVSNDDAEADCTIKVAMADFLDIVSGKQNPQMAFMMGKLKVDGDMSVALQLGKILG
jgi:putative sterol carrier protein